MSRYSLEIVGDISKAQAEFAKIPGFTEQMAAKSAIAWARGEQKKSEASAKAAKKIKEEMEKAAKQSQNALKVIGEKTFGGVVGDVVDVAEALVSLGPAGVAAGAGILGLGAGLAAIGAAAGAVIGTTAAVIALEQAALGYVKELEKIKTLDLVEPEQVQSVLDANAAIEALQIVAKKLAFDLADELAPTIRSVGITLIDFGLDLVDVLKAFYDSKSAVEVFINSIVAFGSALFNGTAVVGGFLTAVRPIARAMGMNEQAIDGAISTLARHNAAVARSITGLDGLDNAQRDANEPISRGEELLNEMSRSLEEALRKQDKHKEKTKEVKLEYERQGAALRALNEQLIEANSDTLSDAERTAATVEASYQRRVDAAYDAFGQTAMLERDLSALQEALAAAADRRERDYANEADKLLNQQLDAELAAMAKLQAEKDRQAELDRQRLERQLIESQQFYVQLYDTATGHVMDFFESQQAADTETTRANIAELESRLANEEGLSAAKRRSLQAQLAQEKAALNLQAKQAKQLAVFQIVLQGAVAMAQAIASGPPVINLAAIAAQAALLAVNTAAAIATPAPKFHSGSGRMAPDEQQAVIRKGEMVLSERAAMELNRGNMEPVRGSASTQQIYWNGRLMSEVVGMALEQPGPARRFVESRIPARRGYRG